MPKHISQRNKKSSQMSEREKRAQREQQHEAELIEDILNEFKNFDENAVSVDTSKAPEPEYGFEMPEYVKALFSGDPVEDEEEPVPTVADFKLDPKMFEPDEEELLVEPEPELELDFEPDEEIDYFAELFAKSTLSITEEDDDLTSSEDDFEIDEDFDEDIVDTIDEAVDEDFDDVFENDDIASIVEESAGMDVMEEEYLQETETYFSEDEEFFSTRELRSELFTAEFDEKFREMFAGSLDNETRKLGGRKVRSAMVTPDELEVSQKMPAAVPEKVAVPTRRKKKKGKGLWIFLIVLFAVVFVFSGYLFLNTYLSQLKESNELDSLADLVEMAEKGNNGTITLNGVEYEAAEDDGSGNLLKYQQLANMNDDMIGWLSIPNTLINYPVMYTPDDPEHYLHRDFYGEKSSSGLLFVDANCDIENGDNQIIYGHNMKNDSMFGTLDYYKDPKFWEENQYIHYDGLDEERIYQVVCVFEARVLNQDEKGFRYYRFYGSESEEEFNEYVEGIKNLELYDTGVDISYGDKLITLSTCAYFTDEGRFVVVAKQVS